MLTLPPLIVAEYAGQKIYHYDIVSIYHSTLKIDVFYIVHYFTKEHEFYLVPISGASFPILPISYLDDVNQADWEFHGQPDNVLPAIAMPGPEDDFISNLALYLQRHYS